MKEVLGEDDPNILDSEYDVLFCYSNLINYSKEVDLETIKYAKRKASLKEVLNRKYNIPANRKLY